MNRLIVFCFLLLAPAAATALGPHEILLLVNNESPNSAAVAKEFAALRSVPAQNIVELSIPGKSGRFPTTMTPEEFTASIWTPAGNAIKERGIGDHVLAWIYSVDFPTTIKCDPPISITGLTFLKNKLPDPEQTKKGLFLSHLFSDPEYPGSSRKNYPQTFDVFRRWMKDEMPVPAISKGTRSAS